MEDFNNIKDWIVPLLEQKGLSLENFAREVGVSRASIYFYMTDKTRPTSVTMKKMCDVLEVPFEEGLAQYTPRPVGRPKG